MKTFFVVIFFPSGNNFFGIAERGKPISIEAFVSESSIERFDESVLYWLTGLDEVKINSFVASPFDHFLLVNSGPLSTTISFGNPLVQLKRFRIAITVALGRLRATSISTHSLVQSSIMFSVLNLPPSLRPSLVKSIDHRVFGAIGNSLGVLRPQKYFRLPRLRTAKLSSRYSL